MSLVLLFFYMMTWNHQANGTLQTNTHTTSHWWTTWTTLLSAHQRKTPGKHFALLFQSHGESRCWEWRVRSTGWPTLRHGGETFWHTGTEALKHLHLHAHVYLSSSSSVMHTQTQPHMHGLTQPWNPLRLGDLAKQLIHSAFDLFPIFSLQSANWEKQKRRGDCCMSPRDQTKERPRDWQKMLCVWWLLRLCTSKRRAKYRLEALWMVNQHGCIK